MTVHKMEKPRTAPKDYECDYCSLKIFEGSQYQRHNERQENGSFKIRRYHCYCKKLQNEHELKVAGLWQER